MSDDDSVFDWNDHGGQGQELISCPEETMEAMQHFSACALLPLKHASEIRVLEFDPSGRGEDISCRVTTVSLDDAPPFLTLSYACGPSYTDGSHLVRRVICNKLQFAVTDNL